MHINQSNNKRWAIEMDRDRRRRTSVDNRIKNGAIMDGVITYLSDLLDKCSGVKGMQWQIERPSGIWKQVTEEDDG